MPRSRGVKAEKVLVEPKILMQVEEGAYSVRIRSGPGTSYSNPGGRYLGKGVHAVDEIQDGPGSKTGWGHLMSGDGWVGLDFVKKVPD